MAKGAGHHNRSPAVRHDVGHRAVITRMPVGGTEPTMNLLQGKRQLTVRNVFQRNVGLTRLGGGGEGRLIGAVCPWQRINFIFFLLRGRSSDEKDREQRNQENP